ncbi:MAG: MltA domain-containing protein, partial [Bdellovibrionales bacterium]|nr:MltA domain-containing protein [Bdellovibrionales bacterium]
MRRLLLVLLFAGCARAPLESVGDAMRPGDADAFVDAHPLETLRDAFRRNRKALAGEGDLVFGSRTVSKSAYREALARLEEKLTSWPEFVTELNARFDVMEVYGTQDEGWGSVLVTGYYEPEIEGSRRPTPKFSEPLLRRPRDLVTVDLGAYFDRFESLPIQKVENGRAAALTLRGRLQESGQELRVVPYWERGERRNLLGKGLELAWVDPVDAFFLQIQGSGTVRFPGGRFLRLGYEAQNGHPYKPVGAFLLDVIPLEEMSMQRIREYLAAQPRERVEEILNKNPSYVFFQKLPGEAVTFSGAEVTPGRTVATDRGFFPKGALAWLEVEEPRFADPKALAPSEWVRAARFVFDQDTGGAIRGGGR